MDLKNYLVILRRRKWVVITVVLVTMLVVIVGTWLVSPTYIATATLRIATASASTSSYKDYMFADRLITTYINIAISRPLLDELNKQLGLSKAPKISVQQIPNSELIQISVEDHDPNLAMLAANTLGIILVKRGSEFYTGSGKTPADVLQEQVDKAEADLNQLRANYYDHLAKNPDDTAGNQTASKAVDLQQQLYYSLLTQYQQLRSREAIQSNLVSFTDTAAFPIAPSKPNKVLNIALGLVVSLIGGVGLAFLFENLDSTLYTSEQIEDTTGLSALGMVPNAIIRNQLVSSNGSNPYGDAFRRLRTNILTLEQDRPLHTLLVTSPEPGEGKSTIVTNLASAMAKFGQKVVIIDCDMRLPTLHKVFNLPNEQGLSTVLTEKTELESTIQETTFPGVWVLTSGPLPRNPAELLGSRQMSEVIEKLCTHYATVLIDTPSILEVTDAAVLAPYVDGVILVVNQAHSHREQVHLAIKQLADVKAKTLGVVINRVERKSSYYYYYKPTKALPKK
jgi:polysaccharide biosynthesis transport protein